MDTEVPCSYPLVHRGEGDRSAPLLLLVYVKGRSGEVELLRLVGLLIFLRLMLLGDSLEVGSLPGGDVFLGDSIYVVANVGIRRRSEVEVRRWVGAKL